MTDSVDSQNNPNPPSRSDKREAPNRPDVGHVQGVEATPGGLVRATLCAAAAAGAILIFGWLPAEYGIDPTGVGRLLGLTEMGEIKQQLYAEAAAEDAAMLSQRAEASGNVSISGPEVAERLAVIESQVAAIATAVGARSSAGNTKAQAQELEDAERPPPVEPPALTWRDKVSYTLGVGEGVEVKLAMAEGTVAQFEWTANGAVLNHDTHGDGGGQRITYKRGRGVRGEQGELVAAFTGNHGWFWRNRTDGPVTFTLRTRGQYQKIIAP